MRPLNRNERLLATLFGAMAFLLLNLVGMKWIANQTANSRAEISRLKGEADAARTLLKEKPYWNVRQEWVEEHVPQAFDERTSQSQFVQEVQDGLKKFQLTTQQQQPLPTEHEGRLAIAGIEVTVEGRLEAIVRWLHELQQPGSYDLVRSFTLRQAEDGNTMQAVVRLGKVYRAGDLASYP
jgi:hypothetical protein